MVVIKTVFNPLELLWSRLCGWPHPPKPTEIKLRRRWREEILHFGHQRKGSASVDTKGESTRNLHYVVNGRVDAEGAARRAQLSSPSLPEILRDPLTLTFHCLSEVFLLWRSRTRRSPFKAWICCQKPVLTFLCLSTLPLIKRDGARSPLNLAFHWDPQKSKIRKKGVQWNKKLFVDICRGETGNWE